MGRRIFKILSEIFSNILLETFLSILLAIVAFPQVETVSKLNFEEIESIAVFLLLVFAVATILRLFAELCAWISLQFSPNIKVVAMSYIDTENGENRQIENNFAVCEVRNHEFEELTECYAVLKEVYVFDSNFGFVDITTWMFTKSLNKRLGWKNTDQCQIKIGPHTGREELRVYRLQIDHSKQDYLISDFNVCENKYRWSKNYNDELFFALEIYGKLGGIDIHPIKFFGCVAKSFAKTGDAFSYGLSVTRVEQGAYKIRTKLDPRAEEQNRKENTHVLTKKGFLKEVKEASRKNLLARSNNKKTD